MPNAQTNFLGILLCGIYLSSQQQRSINQCQVFVRNDLILCAETRARLTTEPCRCHKTDSFLLQTSIHIFEQRTQEWMLQALDCIKILSIVPF